MTEGPIPLIDAQRAIELDPFALEIARRFVENSLIDRRERRISTLAPNGLVCLERDGSESSAIRLSTRDALMLGIRAYLASTSEPS